jgi:hypothetical protein
MVVIPPVQLPVNVGKELAHEDDHIAQLLTPVALLARHTADAVPGAHQTSYMVKRSNPAVVRGSVRAGSWTAGSGVLGSIRGIRRQRSEVIPGGRLTLAPGPGAASDDRDVDHDGAPGNIRYLRPASSPRASCATRCVTTVPGWTRS